MEVLAKIRENYKYDLFAILILVSLFAFLAKIFVGHQGHPIIDCFGQSAYIPSEVLNGKVLYKDLFVLYGPFSYQFNALLFFVFGENLNTLYAAGIVNSLIILFTLYLIVRTISSRWAAFTVSTMVMCLCVFHHYIFNYIFPYAYAAPYALSSMLLAVLFCIYYIKSSNPKFIIPLLVFSSISILSKPDFLFLFILIAFIITFLKPAPWKYLSIGAVSSLVIPVISFSTLFIQGLSLKDLSVFFNYVSKFINSPLYKAFYSKYSGMYFSLQNLSFNLSHLKDFFLYLIIAMMLVYTVILLISSKSNEEKKYLNPIRVLIVLLLSYSVIKFYIYIHFPDTFLSWIVIFNSLIILVFLAVRYRQKTLNNLSFKDKIFIFIGIAGIAAALRSYFYIDLHSFGTFVIPLSLMFFVIFLLEYVPGILKFPEKDIWVKSCSIILIAMSLAVSSWFIEGSKKYSIGQIETQKGTFYTLGYMANPLNKAINYINQNTPQNAYILMIPQGPILNFLTDRPSNGWYYDLIPPWIYVFDEDKIILSIKANPPDYILVNNKNSLDWGYKHFGWNYGRKIFSFITKNYTLEKEFGSRRFKIKIYKLKNGGDGHHLSYVNTGTLVVI